MSGPACREGAAAPGAGAPPVAAVVLAAGQGKRMASDLPKVMHEVGGRPLLAHVLDRLDELGVRERVVVVGHGRERVIPLCEARRARWAVQERQLGTADAFRQAARLLGRFRGTVLVLCGDTPLLTPSTLRRLLEVHRLGQAAVTVLSADLADPSGYGRVVRNRAGDIVRIVEEKDAAAEERDIREINTAIYALEYPEVNEVLPAIGADNRQGEYYLTELVALFRGRGRRVGVLRLEDAREALGVNTLEQLAEAEGAYAELRAEGRL